MADLFMGSVPYLLLVLLIAALGFTAFRLLQRLGREAKEFTVDSSGDPVIPEVKGDKKLFAVLLAIAALTYGILADLAWMTWNVVIFEWGPIVFNVGFPVLLAGFAHAVLSFKNLPEDRVGGLYFYGHALKNADTGLHFAPFMRLETGPKDVQKLWIPGREDEIFWGDEEVELPSGMVRPVFFNTRPPREGETEDLDVQMTLGAAWSLFWQINNFLTFNAHTRSDEEANEQLRSVSTAVLGEEFATRTVNGNIVEQAEINANFDNTIRKRVRGWGVLIIRANLVKINPSHTLAISMRDRATAGFEADAVRIAADAEAYRLVTTGKAQGESDYYREAGPLWGRADGFAEIAKATEAAGTDVLAAETLREAMPKSTYVVGGGFGQLLDTVKEGFGKFAGKESK